MSIKLSDLVSRIDPYKTVLFFGAGSSITSGAPSVQDIINKISDKFRINKDGYSLSEISSIAENKYSRTELISAIRELFQALSVTGALENLPLYDWRKIYTTNYDNLIEQAYAKKRYSISYILIKF